MRIISFTDRGEKLASRLAHELGGTCCRCNRDASLADWVREGFEQGEDLVFVGAVGIAVRAIAPHVKSKACDPAVVVVDECARHAVALLSGHLGGANELALQVARACGADPVITTATDCNQVFAIDAWARRQGCTVANPGCIKRVSSRLLAGKEVTVASNLPIEGEVPSGVRLTRGVDIAGAHADAVVTWRQCVAQDTLRIVPRVLVLGVGCRRGVPIEVLEARFGRFCAAHDMAPQAIGRVCSIDLKAGEPGLLGFCENHGWKLETFSAEELAAVAGDFSSSPFVAATVGVDNVCERAAVLGSDGGELVCRKDVGDGATFAAALMPRKLSWG